LVLLFHWSYQQTTSYRLTAGQREECLGGKTPGVGQKHAVNETSGLAGSSDGECCLHRGPMRPPKLSGRGPLVTSKGNRSKMPRQEVPTQRSHHTSLPPTTASRSHGRRDGARSRPSPRSPAGCRAARWSRLTNCPSRMVVNCSPLRGALTACHPPAAEIPRQPPCRPRRAPPNPRMAAYRFSVPVTSEGNNPQQLTQHQRKQKGSLLSLSWPRGSPGGLSLCGSVRQ
jgi:hypothetical protein